MSRRSGSRASRLLGLGILCVCLASGRAVAQAWSAQLVLAPMPSPFLSDWEMDPTIGQLIITNPGAAATDVTLHYTVTRNGKMLMRGTTDPLTIPGQQSVVFTGASTFGGRADWDRDVQQTIARTGKLPEGEYEGCVTLLGPGRIVLVERQCARFTTQTSDPPFLISPANGDTLNSRDPIFEWQPVQVPPAAAVRVGYVLQIAEVRTAAGQRPEVALESNILHYVEPNLVQTSHQYPVGALPLVSGRTYAWRVQALDGDGKPAATNQGRSEIWTFVYRETETEVTRTVARLELTPRRDTLRYAGDTARYEVTAYDADNVEIIGKRALWRSIDTTIARVDSTGMVTGARAGETRIVATIEGVADSALSVTAQPTNLAVRFESYDAGKDTPSLLALIQSGPFEEVAPRLMEHLRSGEFRIPLPRLPGISGAELRDSDAEDADVSSSGPQTQETRMRARAVECADSEFNVREPYFDADKRVFVFYVPLNQEQRTGVTSCLGVPNDTGVVEDVEQLRGAIFVINWDNKGLPRVFLASKGIGIDLGLSVGPKLDVRYLLINVSNPVEVSSALLPPQYGGFFGDVSFDAGRGVTYYARRNCGNADTRFCDMLRFFNPEKPEITITAFAGITASEVSVARDSGQLRTGVSEAKGFTITARGPVTKLGWSLGSVSLDSVQGGLTFAVQDSVVMEKGKDADNWSIGAGFVYSAWITANATRLQLDGSAGLEWDPSKFGDTTKADRRKPKLVLTATMPQVLHLYPLRVGAPSLVFTTPLLARTERAATTLAISGTWGIGPIDGVRIADVEGEFEQLGRAQVSIEWKNEIPSMEDAIKTGYIPDSLKQQRDSAMMAVTRQLHIVRDARERLAAANVILREEANAAAKAPVTQSGSNPNPGGLTPPAPKPSTAAATVAAAERDLAAAEAELAQLRSARASAREAIRKSPCAQVWRGRCVTWSVRGSINSGSLMDIAALVARWMTGLQ